MTNIPPSKTDIKRFKAIGHKLHPIVTVAEKGLNNSVMSEIVRALNDHELIKVAVKHPDRDEKRRLMESLCAATGATLIQTIGHTALVFKPAKEPNPKLSNLLRFL